MEKKITSIAASTTIEVENLLQKGKVTLNQAREQLGLKKISDPIGNQFLKRDKESS
ncbi:hypothetical protein [Lysinibacillus sp. LZ02]|uniref:hypothetical protein n=1 Tax=Lysinibacillus sp. LZ02 TaxID=3420668 RepID=UPI003D35F623